MRRPGRVLAAALAGLLVACAATAAPAPQTGQPAGLPELRTIDGARRTPDALRGKVVVLAWFASYCPFCMQEAPKLQKLYAANARHLLVVGVNVDPADPARSARVRQWTAKYGWTFPVTLDAGAVERALGKPRGIPALVVVDAAGVVRQVETGEMLDEDFDEIAAGARRQVP
jgi:thiol-disulfide isomerase/thioredoxin